MRWRVGAGRRPATGADEEDGAEAAAPGEHGDDDGPPFGGGVYGGGEHTQADADGAAEEGERDGFGEELDTDVAFGGSEGSA